MIRWFNDNPLYFTKIKGEITGTNVASDDRWTDEPKSGFYATEIRYKS